MAGSTCSGRQTTQTCLAMCTSFWAAFCRATTMGRLSTRSHNAVLSCEVVAHLWQQAAAAREELKLLSDMIFHPLRSDTTLMVYTASKFVTLRSALGAQLGYMAAVKPLFTSLRAFSYCLNQESFSCLIMSQKTNRYN